MLLECNNCGAPLDVEGKPDLVKCGYCGASASLAHLRTLNAQTPKDWQRPKQWRPPEHVPANSAQTYRYRGKGSQVPVAVALGVLALVGVAGAVVLVSLRSSGIPSDGSCPSSWTGIGQSSLRCRCGPNPTAGSVWGSGIYTADSALCRAALHAGAVSAAGGEVAITSAAGCPSYSGSVANGVESHSWGRYGQSFYFVGHGDGRCASAPAPTVAAAADEVCPSTFPNSTGGRVSCTCTPTQFSGAVWGSGIYTTDSSLCNAALHAGAVPSSGGAVVAVAAPGCASYQGSSRHGVATGSWKQYQQSFYFDGHGSGQCR